MGKDQRQGVSDHQQCVCVAPSTHTYHISKVNSSSIVCCRYDCVSSLVCHFYLIINKGTISNDDTPTIRV